MLKDLRNIKVVSGICPDCLLYTGYNSGCNSGCNITYTKITNETCVGYNKSHGNIIKKEEVWEICTRENTSIGDIVYTDIDCEAGEVTYINKYEDYFYLDVGDNESEYPLGEFKIKK